MGIRINYIYQLNYFWDKVEAENSLKPTSICIYLSLLNINNSCGWKNPFRVTFSQVLSQTGIANTKTYYTGLHELVEAGFITWTKSKNQHQAAEFSINVLNQNLEEQGHSKVIASPKQLDEQGHSNSHILKQENNKLKTNKDQVVPTSDIDSIDFIKYFNSKANRKFKATAKVKASLKARSKEYTNAEIKSAIDNAHADDYHKGNNFKYLTPEYILRVDKIEMFHNQKQSANNPTGIIIQTTN